MKLKKKMNDNKQNYQKNLSKVLHVS